jgi:hypothetical protein
LKSFREKIQLALLDTNDIFNKNNQVYESNKKNNKINCSNLLNSLYKDNISTYENYQPIIVNGDYTKKKGPAFILTPENLRIIGGPSPIQRAAIAALFNRSPVETAATNILTREW